MLRLSGLESSKWWLQTDTHWSGEGACVAAEQIADSVRDELGLAKEGKWDGEELARESRTGRGDLAMLLGAGASGRLITSEETSAVPLSKAHKKPSDEKARVYGLAVI